MKTLAAYDCNTRYQDLIKIIGTLRETVNELEEENEKLSSTVEWMHDAIWEQLRIIRELEQKEARD